MVTLLLLLAMPILFFFSKTLTMISTIKNLAAIFKNTPRMMEWSAELLAASPTATVTISPFVFTANPSNLEHLAKSRFDNYPKSEIDILHDFLGDGILNVNSNTWRSQRKTASAEFNTRSIRSFVLNTVSHEVSSCLVPLLATASQSGEVLDLQDLMGRLAFDAICRLVFDEDPHCLGGGSEESERFYRAFDEAGNMTIYRWMYPFHWMWKLMRWLDIGSEKLLRASMTIIHESINWWIRSRRSNDKGRSNNIDLLSRFVEYGEISDKFLRDILINFVLAGRDTTPTALTWFFWVLSSRPDVVQKIVDEIRSIRTKSDHEAFTLDELRRMHYLHAAVSESMRMYPPISLVARKCGGDDELVDGTKVRKGWTVMCNLYAMGRAESIWGKDCGEFRPERWLDEDGDFQPRDSFRYTVFHAGPRVCLGKELAYIQMKAVAASILERFELEVVEERGKFQQGLTLRLAGGLPVRVKEIRRDFSAL